MTEINKWLSISSILIATFSLFLTIYKTRADKMRDDRIQTREEKQDAFEQLKDLYEATRTEMREEKERRFLVEGKFASTQANNSSDIAAIKKKIIADKIEYLKERGEIQDAKKQKNSSRPD